MGDRYGIWYIDMVICSTNIAVRITRPGRITHPKRITHVSLCNTNPNHTRQYPPSRSHMIKSSKHNDCASDKPGPPLAATIEARPWNSSRCRWVTTLIDVTAAALQRAALLPRPRHARQRVPAPEPQPRQRHESGAYTRPHFSSTSAISDAKYTSNTPSYRLTPAKRPVNKHPQINP